MSLVTVIWSGIASACLTLAAINLIIWFKKRTAWARLAFSLMATATAAMAGCEIWIMRSGTAEHMATALRWYHLPIWAVILSLVIFTRLHLRAGRLGLGWAACIVRTLSLLLNFLVKPNITFREITEARQISFLGGSVFVPQGVPNPWTLLAQLGTLILVVFLANAAVSAWRRGDRRAALTVGGSTLLFASASLAHSALVIWQITPLPLINSIFYSGVVAAMAYEITRDTLLAGQLADNLRESEGRRKQSEREVDQLRLERTHLARVLTANELSSALAHEINQPLGAILNNAEAARILLSGTPPRGEDIPEILDDIIHDAKRAGEIIRKVRGVVKKTEVQFEPLGVNSMIDDVLALVHGNLAMKNITLRLELKQDVAVIRGDRIRLQQVLLNLVTNALDAMKDAPSKILTVRSAMDGPGLVTVSVGDSGPGIAEARRTLVFQPFFTTKKDGLGLGLSICRSIIEEHGGQIWAENNPAGGTIFSFSLKAWQEKSV